MTSSNWLSVKARSRASIHVACDQRGSVTRAKPSDVGHARDRPRAIHFCASPTLTMFGASPPLGPATRQVYSSRTGSETSLGTLSAQRRLACLDTGADQ